MSKDLAMKVGMLVCSGTGAKKNIGDYIQSLCAEVFFDEIDVLVERESLNEYSSQEKTVLLMNAWYMWHPENWPPSEDIIPLMTSIHINFACKEKMLQGEGYEFFKKHEPIGCRDLGTLDIFKRKGIDSYFSGCMTLTLGEKFFAENRNDQFFFVDPYYECISGKSRFSFRNTLIPLVYGIKNFKRIKPLFPIFAFTSKLSFLSILLGKFERFIQVAAFYKTYSSTFADSVLFNAKYLSHIVLQKDYPTEQEKLEYARHLLSLYSSCKCMVTSRIHAALPAIGMDTPTIFVTSDFLNDSVELSRNGGRFGGLIDFFNVIRYENFDLQPDGELPGFIEPDTALRNKDNHLDIKRQLIEICKTFIERNYRR